jgi:methionyl-tRNA formyltransferase
MKILILISKTSWANSYKKLIKQELTLFSKKIKFISNHKTIKRKYRYDINIIFSYFKIIEPKYLKYCKFNIIPHESDLPKGRGMSPLTWEILNGKKFFSFCLIEASSETDSGKIYFKKKVKIPENILFNEIKEIQFRENLFLIKKFLNSYKKKKPIKYKEQRGKPTFYKSRKPRDHKLNVNKTIKSQFNLLRTSDNKLYPAYFEYKNKKFILKIINL